MKTVHPALRFHLYLEAIEVHGICRPRGLEQALAGHQFARVSGKLQPQFEASGPDHLVLFGC
ncbi:MAG: hypothetical protein LW854_17980 [Rubrivivax sp.]|nr:hypothetical protein [Rubrivivax sp.]